MERLEKLVLFIDDLEMKAKPALNEGSSVVTEQTRVAAGKMKDSASELRDFVSSLKPPDDDSTESSGEEPLDSVGRNMEEQQAKGNVIEIAKNTIGSILPMLDPPSNESIFGLDVQRGCMLSRYHFSRQLWIHRPTGGMIDVLHFPAVRGNQLHPELVAKNSKAVLYCNPNAGLIEIATGMSLTGGNLPHSEPGTNVQDDCWVDYYTALGMDVYVFNYAGYGRSFGGYGRSFGTTMCVSTQGTQGDLRSGFLSRMARIVRSTLLAFQPTPDTLRADGVTVAKHLLSEGGVNHLYIHGESIGGVAASGTARYLSQTALSTKLSMLICDRTFCNLEAIAQRLVGEWSGYAIAFLTPAWNTDVAGDFLAASCPKVIASDAADAIIAEPSSLKAGVALWKELHRGASSTKRIGWVPETPLQYRMADWENCCVNDSRFISKDSLFHAQPPTWPRDKHLSVEETFHFAACCKRIGRLATQVARASAKQIDDANTQANVDLHQQPLVVQAWAVLGGCDGLTGATLGVATKRGFDATVTWLCASVVYGGQVVIEKAEERMHQRQGSASGVEVLPSDFDNRPPGFELLERDGSISFPKPIPVVVELLVSFLEVGDPNVAKCK